MSHTPAATRAAGTHQEAPPMTASTGLFGSTGAPTAKWSTDGVDLPVGTSYAGEIVELEDREQTDYDDKTKVVRWPDGRIKYAHLATLATDQRDPAVDGDDGQRTVWVSGKYLEKAVKDAVYASGARQWEIGGWLSVTFAGYGKPSKPGARAPRLYEAVYRPPTPEKRAEVAAQNAAAQQQVAAQAAVQQAAGDPWASLPADPWNAGPATPAAPAPAAGQLGLDLDGLSPEAKAALLARLQTQ